MTGGGRRFESYSYMNLDQFMSQRFPERSLDYVPKTGSSHKMVREPKLMLGSLSAKNGYYEQSDLTFEQREFVTKYTISLNGKTRDELEEMHDNKEKTIKRMKSEAEAIIRDSTWEQRNNPRYLASMQINNLFSGIDEAEVQQNIVNWLIKNFEN